MLSTYFYAKICVTSVKFLSTYAKICVNYAKKLFGSTPGANVTIYFSSVNYKFS